MPYYVSFDRIEIYYNQVRQKYIEELYHHELDGIICVNMLGEGFDFPDFKIAAVHAPKKTLMGTLQFIGRFVRTTEGAESTACFIAVNNDNLKIENRKLYAEDAVWNEMIIGLGDAAISEKIEEAKFINKFEMTECVSADYFHLEMGKHNDLRRTLEEYLDVDDVWWSFEYALSRIDVKRMANSAAVKTSLDFFDGFHPEESAAGYFAAIDGAADPMYIICSELPRSFRRWVNSLKWGTDNLPLKKMIHQPYVLCFNYTEFIESEYGVSHDKVCYIHGCRQNKNQPLILGHLEGDSDDMYNFEDDYSLGQKNPLVQLAQENIVEKITYYDQSLTKHCDEIISRNGEFFDKLENIENIIIIGHSLADVDRDYFREIVRNNIDCQKLNWFFGCYGIGDLRQISSFIEDLKIPKENIYIFRTDSLNIPFRKTEEQSIKRASKKSGRILCRLADEQWTVKTDGNRLSIMNSDGDAVLSHLFIQPPRRAFFDEIGQFLIVVLNGQTSGIYVYHKFDTTWKLIDELPTTGQSIINSRLRKVFLEQQCLTFVYNNRVKSYNLSTCKLINNEGLMGAKDKTFSGTEITRYFKN